MEKRSWPWKKKITEKLASAAMELKHSNEQLDSRLDLNDQSNALTPLQQAEIRVKRLTEEIAAKNEVVAQHAKVAEEAVTGWERAESEAARLSQLLDGETHKRMAAEDKVFHFDGALKECMRQLRLVREQQEKQLRETMVRKSREFELVREEMEAKLAKLTNNLLESEAEKTAMSKSLHERSMLIKSLNDSLARVEEEAKHLQVRLQMSEKEQAKWKYEVHVLTKEVQIRNEELEFSKKATEAAGKQHLENVKKLAKFDAECQRLRVLVRKKLPGPAAIAQMRIEAEALGIVPPSAERGRRMSPRKNQVAGRKSERPSTAWMSVKEEDGDHHQLHVIEEENRMLKEALDKSKNELHATRSLCACTVGKLSSVEQQLKNSAPSYQATQSMLDGFESRDLTVVSVSEDGVPEDEISYAESWATALVSELAHFRNKEKGSSISEATMGSNNCELMDDFMEMEKLASLSSAGEFSSIGAILQPEPIHKNEHSGVHDALHNLDITLQREFNNAHALDESSESNRNDIRAKEGTRDENLVDRQALSRIERHLTSILEAGVAVKLGDVLSEIQTTLMEVKQVRAVGSVKGLDQSFVEGMETAEVRDTRVWSPSGHSSCQSDESTSGLEGTVKMASLGSQLAAAMHKVLSLVEALSQADYDVHASEVDSVKAAGDSLVKDDAQKHLRSSEFSSCVQSIVVLCNGHLQDKLDILDFVVEMVSALDWIVSHVFSLPIARYGGVHRKLHWEKSKCIDNSPYTSGIDDSVEVLSCGHGASENEIKIHLEKIRSLEDQLIVLTLERDSLDAKLKSVSEDLELSRSQSQDSDKNATQVQPAVLESKQSSLMDVAIPALAKCSFDSQVGDTQYDSKKLQEKIVSLEVLLHNEVQCRKDIEAMFQELQEKHSCCNREMVPKDNNVNADGDKKPPKAIKEQEIALAAERLAECQQTILTLGKQLHDLGVPSEASFCPDEWLQLQSNSRGVGRPTLHQAEADFREMPSLKLNSRDGGITSYAIIPSPDAYGANVGMISPDYQESGMFARPSAKELPLTSLARSPGRFLSLKSRSPSEAKPDSSMSEKHSSGFSRFFSRNKAAR